MRRKILDSTSLRKILSIPLRDGGLRDLFPMYKEGRGGYVKVTKKFIKSDFTSE
jgi:hypothetical protein